MNFPLKFTSLILILSFLSFYSVSGEDFGPVMSYSNPIIQKYAEDAWKKLYAEGRTRGATDMGFADVYCPHVKTIGEEPRYSFLVIYGAVGARYTLYCHVYVWTKSHDPLTIDCYHGFWNVSKFVFF